MINVLRRPEKARYFGLGLPKGLLFFGPPGTGKSLFANALASEVQLPFINLVTENIYSKWLGESGQNMKNAITLAEKMSPAIVFVDEIDRFGKRAGASAGSAEEETQRVFSQFLEWLGMPEDVYKRQIYCDWSLAGPIFERGLGIKVDRDTGDVTFICDSYGGYERLAGQIKEKVVQNYIALCVTRALASLNYEVEMEEVKHPTEGKKVLVKGVL